MIDLLGRLIGYSFIFGVLGLLFVIYIVGVWIWGALSHIIKEAE